MKKFFLTFIIFNCTFLIGTASAQWWVQGGNLLWPYGTVTVKDSFSVNGNASFEGSVNFAGNTNFGSNSIFSGNVSFDSSLNVSGDLNLSGTINGVRVYTALLSQSLTSAPEPLILENTFPDSIIWSRAATGRYTATFSDFTITSTKLFINAPRINYDSGNSIFYSINYVVTPYDITIRQDYTDISDWLGASINYEGAMYYPVQFILYP